MKIKNLFVVLLLGLLPACATPLASEQSRNDLLEAAFRYFLPLIGERDGAVFLREGRSNGESKDPPMEVMNRLADLPFLVRPASQAQRSNDDGLRDIVDPKTGQFAVIFTVSIAKVTRHKVLVWFSRSYGPLNAYGYEMEAIFENGKWSFKDTGHDWTS